MYTLSRRRALQAALAALVTLTPANMVTACPSDPEEGATVLAFGDSITVGTGASVPPVTGYVALLATALGFGVANYAVGGVAMNTATTGILAQMLSIPAPTHYETVVMTVGTNDMGLYGTDPTKVAEFGSGLRTGLRHLTSRRRIPEPTTDQERRLVRRGQQLPSVPDGPRVFVGNTPKQVTGSYVGAASPAAQALYAAQVSSEVTYAQSQGWRVYIVDVASAYDPVTQNGEPPSGIHPNDAGHLAIKNAFYAAIRG